MIIITPDPSRKLIRVLVGRSPTIEDLHRFLEEEQAAVRRMGLGTGEFDLLVQTVENELQPSDIANEWQRLLVAAPLKARKIAIVREGALTRVQARRVSSVREEAKVFEKLATAEEWLAE